MIGTNSSALSERSFAESVNSLKRSYKVYKYLKFSFASALAI